jgi:hypothetical protein
MTKTDPPIHLATLITAPPDGCPNCLTHNVRPTYNVVEGDEVTGKYWCPNCYYDWKTSWRIGALG